MSLKFLFPGESYSLCFEIFVLHNIQINSPAQKTFIVTRVQSIKSKLYLVPVTGLPQQYFTLAGKHYPYLSVLTLSDESTLQFLKLSITFCKCLTSFKKKDESSGKAVSFIPVLLMTKCLMGPEFVEILLLTQE